MIVPKPICLQIHLRKLISEVTPHHVEVKSGTAATVSCVITEISSQMTVEWLASSGRIDNDNTNYIQKSGAITAGKQTATLEAKLPKNDETFTCRVKSAQFIDSPPSHKTVQMCQFVR